MALTACFLSHNNNKISISFSGFTVVRDSDVLKTLNLYSFIKDKETVFFVCLECRKLYETVHAAGLKKDKWVKKCDRWKTNYA